MGVVYIAFCGYHGVGKDFFADRLLEALTERGIPVVKTGCGHELKHELEQGFGKRVAWAEGAIKTPEKRRLLQGYGEVRREQDKNYWVREWLNRVAGLRQGEDLVVLHPNAYHLNELAAADLMVFLGPLPQDFPAHHDKDTPGSLRGMGLAFDVVMGDSLWRQVDASNEHSVFCQRSILDNALLVCDSAHREKWGGYWQSRVLDWILTELESR